MSLYIDIKKKYKAGFSLEVSINNEGETLGMLGPSGSGKSLTLKCIAGLETPDEGIIKVGNRVVYDSAGKIDLPPQKRNVGYLFQNYALFPNMTVRKNIELAIRKKEAGKESDAGQNKEKLLGELINKYELSGLEDRYPVDLSGGQQQRAALARIFAYKPEILLLDEPFSALDAFLRENMQVELMKTIGDYDGDVILVTHNRDEVYKLCDRLLIINDGDIIGAESPKSLFSHPGNTLAARITGCKNIVPFKRTSERTGVVQEWGMNFEVNDAMAEDHTYIGIRAHSFKAHETLKTTNSDGRCNHIEVKVKNIINGPFEKTVILHNADNDTGSEIWWICDKDTDVSKLRYLSVDKNDILLLRETYAETDTHRYFQ